MHGAWQLTRRGGCDGGPAPDMLLRESGFATSFGPRSHPESPKQRLRRSDSDPTLAPLRPYPGPNSVTTSAEWLWGWDPTPGIVAVHAELNGRATVWRRVPESGLLVREDERFRPWLLLD